MWCFAICLFCFVRPFIQVWMHARMRQQGNYDFVFNVVLKFCRWFLTWFWWCFVVLCVSYCLLFVRACGQTLEMFIRWYLFCILCSLVFLFVLVYMDDRPKAGNYNFLMMFDVVYYFFVFRIAFCMRERTAKKWTWWFVYGFVLLFVISSCFLFLYTWTGGQNLEIVFV